jgi:hypothetical protein
LLLPALFLGLACDARLPLSPFQTDDTEGAAVAAVTPDAPHGWDDKLAEYRRQAARLTREVTGKRDFSRLFGRGRNSVSGNGTFIGEGTGSSTLQGVGVVTGEVEGMVMIRGTTDINVDGLKYSGQKKGFEVYKGYGFFTATSDTGQKIEVVVVGDGWVVGAGTGIVFWSGDQGWVFWYR